MGQLGYLVTEIWVSFLQSCRLPQLMLWLISVSLIERILMTGGESCMRQVVTEVLVIADVELVLLPLCA